MKKLTKGLRRDERPTDQPEGSWRDARNIVVYKQLGAQSVEDGVLDITPTAKTVDGINYNNFPVNKIVIGTIVTNLETVYFFGGTGLYDSEIGLLNKDGNYRTIIKDDITAHILNFNINYPIKGTSEYRYNNELIIGFNDNHNYPRVLNLNCIPFNVFPSGIVDPLNIDKARQLLQQFPNMQTPFIEAETNLKVVAGAGTLKSGVYYLSTSYELADGTSTFYNRVYNGVPIYVDATSNIFEKVGGAVAGLPTNKSIDVTFTNVDVNFKYLKLAYIYEQNGVSTAFFSSKVLIDNVPTVSMSITGGETTKVEIPIDEILVPNAVYTKAVGITHLQGRLYEANLEESNDINLQPIANELVVEWVREKQISLNNRVLNTYASGVLTDYGSYKDPTMVFFNKCFKDGECYALYLVGKLKNGLYTKAFHIPGREVTAGDRTALNGTDTEIDAIAATGIKKFQIKDTSNSSGQMGAWENEDEYYPLDVTGLAVHPDYANIPGIGVAPADRRVRHHVFPDLRSLKGYGENYQIPVASTSCNYAAAAPNNSPPTPNREYAICYYNFLPTFTGSNCFTVNPVDDVTRFEGFPKAGIFTLNFDFFNICPLSTFYDCLLQNSGISSDDYVAHGYADWEIRLNGVVVNTYSLDSINLGFSSNGFPCTPTTFTFAVTPGDQIDVRYIASVTTNNNAGGLAFQISNFVQCWRTGLTADFSTRQIDSKILGIKISNLSFPQDIVDDLDSWEIFYSKRSNNNIRVVAQDMIKDERYHNFDLLSTQAVAQAKYLKPQLNYNGTGSFTGLQLQDTLNTPNIENAYPTEEFKVINTFQYCGENTSIPQANANRALNVCIVAGVGQTTASYIQGLYGNTNTLTDICIYRKNMYAPFDTQELVATGYSFKVSVAGLQPVQKVFGGDTYINTFGFRLYINNTNNYMLTCGSASNIGLRFDEPSLTKYYYPKTAIATPSYYGYNRDYNCLNVFNTLVLNGTNGNCNTDKIITFHQRVIYSIVGGNETKFLNWRVFKVDDYYEMPKNKGVITSLLGVDRKLFIHHEYSLFLAEIKDSIATGTGDVYLKSSQLFDRPPIEVESINEGFGGNQSHFATIFCKLGYCFIDRNAKKVFIYNGELKEVSENGLYNFFKDHAQTTLEDVDNPYIGNGYMLAYDETYKRLLLTKNDPNYSFTLSFTGSSWIAFHDYIPNVLTYNRKGLVAVDNNNNKVFKHNNTATKAKYYDGTIKDSYIEVVFNPSPETSKVVRSVNWLSDTVDALGATSKDETITHLLIFNNTQCSGLIDLKQDKGIWFGTDARNIEDTWNFNDFRDLIKDKNLPFLDNKNQLIVSNINTSKAWFDKSLFIGKFVTVRFINDNINQKDLHIMGINVTLKKSDRI